MTARAVVPFFAMLMACSFYVPVRMSHVTAKRKLSVCYTGAHYWRLELTFSSIRRAYALFVVC